MSDKPTKEDEINYQVYIDERKSLVEGEQAGADQFDKHILTLAGGALGISIVFLEKIAPNPDPKTLIVLKISWFLLVLSMLLTLASFLTSQHAHRRQRKILEEEFFSKKRGEKNRWAVCTQCLNWLSIASFIIGVSMLAWFSIQNVKHDSTGQKTKTNVFIGESNEQ